MWAAQGHGSVGGIHTPVCPGVCTVLLISAVYSATTLCCLLFRGHCGQEDQCIIQWIRKDTSARKGSIHMSHGKCSEAAYSLYGFESIRIWRVTIFCCDSLQLPSACCIKVWLLVLSLLWEWMYTGRIRDVVTWGIHTLPAGWLHDWHGEITDMLNSPFADRRCFTKTVALKPLAKKVVRGQEVTNHSEEILSGPIPYGVAWCFAAGTLFSALNNPFTYHWNENQYL